jgi:MoaA/NifB/PqqE/SkfB family radical SAM enzyme
MLYSDYQKKIENFKTFGFRFEVHLTEHCNLNCKGCSHFSPLAKNEFMDIDVFEKDMKRMAELFSNEIQNIRLLGGEPLLHPRVNDFMVITKKYFPKIKRELVTNGLLLSNMSESFWETCWTTDTWINITHYPIPLDFTAIERKAWIKGLKVMINPKDNPLTEFRKDVYDLTGMQDAYLSHTNCSLFGYCCQLNNGRFYPCSISAYFHHFNQYFELGLPLSEKNYIDIHKVQSKDEFYKLITTPIPCCKYCNIDAQKFGVKWERSKRNLDEWT